MKSKYALNERQRYDLILECRSSGLTDYQWCTERGIHPGTFYNWVSKLKKKGVTDIPDPCGRESVHPVNKQEVVKVETQSLQSKIINEPTTLLESNATSVAPVEIEFNGATIRISNSVNTSLLRSILDVVGGGSYVR